jgi:hypothetical protein
MKTTTPAKKRKVVVQKSEHVENGESPKVAPPAPEMPLLIPVHEWKNADGEVLIVKCADKDGRGYGGFQYPSEIGGIVEAPDFKATNACGNGIHGWPWGLGLGDGKDPDYREGVWYVIGVKADIVGQLEGGSKCKFKAGIVRYRGQWVGALAFTLQGRTAWIEHASSGAASATGGSGAASATGWRGAASATGECSAAIVTGRFGQARSGEGGCIALAWLNPKTKRNEMRCATTGKEGQLKADTWYSIDESGNFVEVAVQPQS